MKITFIGSKLVSFEEIAKGTVFKDPATKNTYYIKTASMVNEDSGEEEWNCLCLDNYTFYCFTPKYLIYPVYDAELIIP